MARTELVLIHRNTFWRHSTPLDPRAGPSMRIGRQRSVPQPPLQPWRDTPLFSLDAGLAVTPWVSSPTASGCSSSSTSSSPSRSSLRSSDYSDDIFTSSLVLSTPTDPWFGSLDPSFSWVWVICTSLDLFPFQNNFIWFPFLFTSFHCLRLCDRIILVCCDVHINSTRIKRAIRNGLSIRTMPRDFECKNDFVCVSQIPLFSPDAWDLSYFCYCLEKDIPSERNEFHNAFGLMSDIRTFSVKFTTFYINSIDKKYVWFSST